MKFSFESYFIKFAIIAACFFLVPILFTNGPGSSTLSAFIKCVGCFGVLTYVSVKLILADAKYVKYYLLAYLVLIAIGVLHYLAFVQPSYFSGSGSYSQNTWGEYITVISSLEKLYENKHSLGIFYIAYGYDFGASHPEIWNIISFPYFFLGVKWLNFLPLNAFSSLLLSINLVYISQYYSLDEEVVKLVRSFTAFFPLFLLGDTVWRDSFGIALISIAMVLYIVSDRSSQKLVGLCILLFFSFLLRIMYPVIVLGAIGALYLFGDEKRKSNLIRSILFIAFMVLVSSYISGLEENEGYTDSYVNTMSYLALPLKIVMGCIGPFPWTEFFKYHISSHYAYQIAHYLLGIFQLGYLFAIISNFKRFSFKTLGFIGIFGLGIMMTGFISRALHIGYIAEGLIFTLPWFFNAMRKDYRRYMKISFVFLLFLNIIVIVSGGFSIGSIWR